MVDSMRELKVEDALVYLDHVKLEFSSTPEVYNKFLDIMKNFKNGNVDTPGVINRVSTLFRGYNRLILGFNTFLPDGYKIDMSDIQRMEAERVAQERAAGLERSYGQSVDTHLPNGFSQHIRPAMGQHNPPPLLARHHMMGMPKGGGGNGGPDGGIARAPPAPNRLADQGMSYEAQKRRYQTGGHGEIGGPGIPRGRRDPPPPVASNEMGVRGGPASPSGMAEGPVEFDNAISYVTTIKRRFAKEPQTYKAFLEILHTYQEEQRGIKDVLEQVSSLFADHPDLLTEFTYFLPDAVQEQAKERLDRAAHEAEMKKAQRAAGLTSKAKPSSSTAKKQSKKRPVSDQQAEAAGPPPGKRPRPPQPKGSTWAAAEPPKAAAKPPKAAKRKSSSKKASSEGVANGEAPSLPAQPRPHYHISPERSFFDQAKEVLSAQSKEAWGEFVKCLELYSQEVVSRAEMLQLAGDLLSGAGTLLDDFKRMLMSIGSSHAEMGGITWHSTPLSEIDFSLCRRCTPSYRALPQDYPRPQCTERGGAEQKVLNDTWVSVPVGSEDSSNFKHMRRNQWEETLFKTEEERFELDMIIDANASTIRRLEPLAMELEAVKEAAEDEGGASDEDPSLRIRFTLDRRALSAVHLSSIGRIYGEYGGEVLHFLQQSPAIAIPIILKRLKQKDAEWRNARNEANRGWNETVSKSFHKSLDHRSFYLRKEDKHKVHTKGLLEELHGPNLVRKKAGLYGELRPPMPDIIYPCSSEADFNKTMQEVKSLLMAGAEGIPPPKGSTAAVAPAQIKLLQSSLEKGGYAYLLLGGPGTGRELRRLVPAEAPGSIDPAGPTYEEGSDPHAAGANFAVTSHWYFFVRIHALIFERLALAKKLCRDAQQRRDAVASNPRATLSSHVSMEDASVDGNSSSQTEGGADAAECAYQAFLALAVTWLTGTITAERFEDAVRQLMGNSGYPLFSMDILVTHALKYLGRAAADKLSDELFALSAWQEHQFQNDMDDELPYTLMQRARSILKAHKSSETLFRLQRGNIDLPGVHDKMLWVTEFKEEPEVKAKATSSGVSVSGDDKEDKAAAKEVSAIHPTDDDGASSITTVTESERQGGGRWGHDNSGSEAHAADTDANMDADGGADGDADDDIDADTDVPAGADDKVDAEMKVDAEVDVDGDADVNMGEEADDAAPETSEKPDASEEVVGPTPSIWARYRDADPEVSPETAMAASTEASADVNAEVEGADFSENKNDMEVTGQTKVNPSVAPPSSPRNAAAGTSTDSMTLKEGAEEDEPESKDRSKSEDGRPPVKEQSSPTTAAEQQLVPEAKPETKKAPTSTSPADILRTQFAELRARWNVEDAADSKS